MPRNIRTISKNRQFINRLIMIVLVMLFLCLIGGTILFFSKPFILASSASTLRRVAGNHTVAQLESVAFLLQDRALRHGSELGLVKAEAPWQTSPGSSNEKPFIATLVVEPSATLTVTITPKQTEKPASRVIAATPTPFSIDEQQTTIRPPTSEPSPTPVLAYWTLDPIPPFGEIPGEGQWQPYIYHPDSSVIGLRTFLQPDPERPHAIVAIVAFDLRKARLHYVLGSEEPALPEGPRGSGYLNPEDRVPNKLLATFNGGFLATHGEYGAMSRGIYALPPKLGAGTTTIGRDGRVQIGVWGDDIDPGGDYLSLRQNASIVVHEGRINDKVYNGSVASWGGNLNGVIVTWRSGLGLSADGQVLYYISGPAMSMPTLARTMISVGVQNGILLDINPYWVHFTAIRSEGEQIVAEALFDEGMETQTDRYLRQSQRDFFYLTAIQD